MKKPSRRLITAAVLAALVVVGLHAAIPASDDFSGTFSTNWSMPLGAYSNSGGTTSSQNGAENIAYWKTATDTFPADQGSQIKVITIGTGGNWVGCRVSGNDVTDTQGYLWGAASSGAAGQVYKMLGGATLLSYTQLGANYGSTISNGDTIKCVVVGNVITPYINGIAQATRTDSAIATGQPGLYVYDPGGVYDDWVGISADIPATDDFSGTFASTWTLMNGSLSNSGGQVSSAGGNENEAKWPTATATFSPDHSSQLNVASDTSGAVFLSVRVSGTAGTSSGYHLSLNGGDCRIYKQTSLTSYSVIGVDNVSACLGVSTMKLTVIGSTLTPSINGVVLAAHTDSALATGQPGFLIYGSGGTADDWVGNNEPVLSSLPHNFGFSHFGN